MFQVPVIKSVLVSVFVIIDHMNMFKDADVDSVESYLAAVPEDRQKAMNFLHDFIQKTVPELEVFFAYNMLGYGKFKYTNYKKEEVDWPIVAMASQKNYMSIYVCALAHGAESMYIAEKYEKQLGKVNVGKSCIRFKKLEDLDLDVLKKVLEEAAENPGLVEAKIKSTK